MKLLPRKINGSFGIGKVLSMDGLNSQPSIA